MKPVEGFEYANKSNTWRVFLRTFDAMHYEHWVQVNDSLDPPQVAVTHAQLWQALVIRAKDPMRFMPALVSVWVGEPSVHSEGQVSMDRRLDFGNFVVSDKATLRAPGVLVIDTCGGPTWPDSSLTIGIEAHGPGSSGQGAAALHLRFVYELNDGRANGELDAMTDAFRRKAYEAADLDMVAHIRQLAASGILGTP